MHQCQTCQSTKLAEIKGKCSDLFRMDMESENIEYEGYIPYDLGIGGGDYIDIAYCLDCGQIQGSFPISQECINSLKKDSD